MSILRQFLPQILRYRPATSACQNAVRFLSTEVAENKQDTRPTVRKSDAVARSQLKDFGKFVAECLPKYIQKVQITAGDELELLIVPDGVVPVLQFLKDHHNAQFSNLADIAGMDVPSRENRFVLIKLMEFSRCSSSHLVSSHAGIDNCY